MRNALDDLYANSFALREAERMRREFGDSWPVRERAIMNFVGDQTSARWNDSAAQNALKMSALVGNLDRFNGSEASRKLMDLKSGSGISGAVLGNLYSVHAAAEAANASIAKILINTQAGIKFSQLEGMISKEWMIPRKSLMNGFVEAGGLRNFKEHLSSIAGMSFTAETFTQSIQGKHIGELLGVSEKLSNSLTAGFAGFSRSYQNLFESFENEHERILSLRPSLVRMPTVEYYNGSVLTRSVTVDEIEDLDINAEPGDSLDYFLARLDSNLTTILHGARQALTSTNPDRVRHFSASFRELLTHLLHMLAPDEEIRTWSTSPQDFEKGRPTRKARLRYICRDINHAPFEEFVKKDIDAVLEFFQLFHRGTHTIATQFTDRQLKALHMRVESAMRFLIEISSDKD